MPADNVCLLMRRIIPEGCLEILDLYVGLIKFELDSVVHRGLLIGEPPHQYL